MNTEHWYYRVFQSAPDLIRELLPGSAAAANALGLDGVLWPRQTTGCAETGSPEFPVVLLKVQMHPDQGFQRRLAAQSCRFLQKHPQVEHLEVVVITPPAGVSGGGALDQPGGAEQAARARPPAQLAHTAGASRKRAGRQQSADCGQPP
ncbi:DUF2887 domain-containing protein [Synechococcus sp. CBW1108]|nr:DUF2887 domain-containing protein [Synechococcus sp. CBW1108]